MFLFRRRNNKNPERDVLRHDAYLFGVEPLTNAHSFGGVIEPDENFFGDGLTKTHSEASLDKTLTHSEWSRSPTRTRSET